MNNNKQLTIASSIIALSNYYLHKKSIAKFRVEEKN